MNISFETNSVAIVTGATYWIWYQIAKDLKKQGLKVYNLDFQVPEHQEDLENFIFCDIRNPKQIEKSFSSILSDNGNIRYLINNAGVNNLSWIWNTPYEETDNIIDTNVKGTYNCVEVLMNLKIKKNITNLPTDIVCIWSMSARQPMTCSTMYCTSKAAIVHMVRNFARELGKKYGYRINSVSPWYIADTKMTEQVHKQVPEVRWWTTEVARKYQDWGLIIQRYWTVQDISNATLFLLSYEASYISGTNLEVTGWQ